jgi:hypothetical protein
MPPDCRTEYAYVIDGVCAIFKLLHELLLKPSCGTGALKARTLMPKVSLLMIMDEERIM